MIQVTKLSFCLAYLIFLLFFVFCFWMSGNSVISFFEREETRPHILKIVLLDTYRFRNNSLPCHLSSFLIWPNPVSPAIPSTNPFSPVKRDYLSRLFQILFASMLVYLQHLSLLPNWLDLFDLSLPNPFIYFSMPFERCLLDEAFPHFSSCVLC